MIIYLPAGRFKSPEGLVLSGPYTVVNQVTNRANMLDLDVQVRRPGVTGFLKALKGERWSFTVFNGDLPRLVVTK